MKRTIYSLIVCCFMMSVIAGCITKGQTIQEIPKPAAQQVNTAASSAELDARLNYHIKPGDILIIKIYPGEEFKEPMEIEVDGDGFINIPLLNRVKVGAETPVDAEKNIAKLLDAQFIVNPSVSLRVKQYHTRSVVILGEVKRPGTYEFPPSGRLTLMKSIAMAEGFTNIAAVDRVRLIRKQGDKQVAYVINAKNIINGKQEDVEIQPEDLVTVEETIF